MCCANQNPQDTQIHTTVGADFPDSLWRHRRSAQKRPLTFLQHNQKRLDRCKQDGRHHQCLVREAVCHLALTYPSLSDLNMSGDQGLILDTATRPLSLASWQCRGQEKRTGAVALAPCKERTVSPTDKHLNPSSCLHYLSVNLSPPISHTHTSLLHLTHTSLLHLTPFYTITPFRAVRVCVCVCVCVRSGEV